MKRILFKNVTIIDPFSEPSFYDNGFIVIKGDMIEEVSSDQPLDSNFDEVIDLKRKTVLPGMINCHTHLYSALAMGLPPPKKDPTSFYEILQEIWWKLDQALDENSTKVSFESGMLECLKSGVTTIFDHHSSPNYISGALDVLAEVAEMFGVNISPTFEITDRNGVERFEKALRENLNAIKNYHKQRYVHPMMGLHASFTLSDSSLKRIRATLDKTDNAGIHIHVAEDKIDQKHAVERGYTSVIDRLNQFNLLRKNSLIIHGLYLTPDDVGLLQQSGIFLIHAPTSNANNRVGMLSTDIIHSLPVGLGTDGMEANMLSEAKEGTLIRSSHWTNNEKNVNYLELLFKNNPKIASRLFGRKIGHLQPGYQADMAIYDYHPRTEMNQLNFISHILFGFGRPSDVITRGKFQIRDGKFMDIPEKEIKKNGQIQSVKLWEKMKTIKPLINANRR